LTTSKWASASGVPFLGDDRTNTGVKPTVEVKRPDTPEAVEVEELIEQQEDGEPTPGTPNAPAPSPTPAADPKPAEDVQLKRALELLGGKTAAAKAGS
jgi:hypothetical protein